MCRPLGPAGFSSARFCILALLSVVLTTGRAGAQDWPMWRHDAQRTARQDLPGMIDVPAVKWRADLGGRLDASQFVVADVDLDGAAEVVLLRGGRIVARRPSGTLVWATEPLGVDSIMAVQDLDGNGRLEVVGGAFWDGVFVIDGSTGALLWRTRTALPIGSVLTLDPDGDGHFDIYVADRGCYNSGVGAARIYSFPDGFAGAVSTVVIDTSAHGYWCGMDQAFGDVDGDGSVELIALSEDRVVTYNIETGAPKDTTTPLGNFPWGKGKTFAADIDADGRDEVLVASDQVAGTDIDTRRLLVVEDQGFGLALRWALRTDAVAGAHRFPEPPFGRLLPGTGLQVVTSFYEPATAAWRLLVVGGDSATPTPIAEVADQAALAVADVDGDGLDEILAQQAATATPPTFSAVRAWKLEAPGLREMWSVAAAVVPRPPAPWSASATALVLPSSDPTGPATLVFVDQTGDERADRLDLISATGIVVASRTWGDEVPGIGVRSMPLGGAPLFATRGDGTVEQLGGDLRLLNDTLPPLGSADLVERSLAPGGAAVAVVGPTGRRRLLALDSTEHLVAFDLGRVDAVSGPAVQWRASERVFRTPLHATMAPAPGSMCRLSFVADAVGSLTLLCQDVGTGAEAARFGFPDSDRLIPYWGMTPLAEVSGGANVAVTTYDFASGFLEYSRLDLDSSRLWPMDISHLAGSGGDGPGSAWDLNGDGQDDFCATVYYDIRLVDGSSGLTIAGGPSLYDATATFDDLDGDTVVDVLHNGALYAGAGPSRLSTSFVGVWSVEPGIWHNRAAAAPTTTGSVSVGTTRHAAARFQIYRGSDGTSVADEILAGGRTWADEASATAAGAAPGELGDVTAASDLAGLGRGSFLVGSTDGHLYVLSADDGTLDWSIDLRAPVGEPIAADVDGDGLSEVVAAVGDGSIYAIDRQELDAPGAVFDTDGTFVAVSGSDELDELTSSSMAAANWVAAAGAAGYEFALLTADETFVVPWTDAGTATRTVLSDLSLQVGMRYHFAVRARASDGAGGVRRSAETVSDGFVVVDRDAPTASVAVNPALIWPLESPPANATTLDVELSDPVGLRNWTLKVRDTSGTDVAQLAGGAIGGTSFTSSTTWDGTTTEGSIVPTGAYVAVVTVDDVGGFTASATGDIFVCAAEADPLCSGADADADGDDGEVGDADADVEPDTTPDGSADEPTDGTGSDAAWTGGGSGCSCTVPGSRVTGGPGPSALLLGLLLGAVVRRRRFRRH